MALWQIIFVFILAWWVSLFLTLPFGVHTPEKPEPGHAAGAPAKTHLATKLVATTVIAVLLTGVVYFIISTNMFPVR